MTPDYPTEKWLPAIVPGTVLNSLVYNQKYPEPYYGVNNKLESKLIPDLSQVGRDFYTYWFRTEFAVPQSFKGKNVWLQLDGIMGEWEFAEYHQWYVHTGLYQCDRFCKDRKE